MADLSILLTRLSRALFDLIARAIRVVKFLPAASPAFCALGPVPLNSSSTSPILLLNALSYSPALSSPSLSKSVPLTESTICLSTSLPSTVRPT